MKTISAFLGVDMRLGHDGLTIYAKKHGLDLAALDGDSACVFINRSKTMIKSYSYNHVICFFRSKDVNRPIDLNALNYLAQTFSRDGKMNYSKALGLALTEKLKLKKLDHAVVK